MTRKLLGLLLAATALPAAAAANPATALPDADPAMWVVKDHDTTIYLFGTFHALDGKQDWLNDEVKTALDASDELVLEIVTPEDPSAMAPIVQKYALDPSGVPLSKRLPAATAAKLAAAAERAGVPLAALEPYRPFFVGMMLTMMEFQKLGMGAAHGSEAVLKKAAGAKPVRAVETLDMQLAMFAGLPEAEQVRMLDGALEDPAGTQAAIKQMLAHWAKGDAAGVARMIQESEGASPAMYKAVFPDRNARWATWIGERLKTPGKVFMAVGAGHLAGADSVQAMLKAKGVDSARVPSAKD